MKTAARSRSEAQRMFVAFVVGDICYALDVIHVVQIINPTSFDPLPYLPSAVVGVADFRGAVVPVIDLRQRFGLMPAEMTRRTKWLIVRGGTAVGALMVDEVRDVFGVPQSEVRPAPRVGDDDLRGLAGVLTHQGRMTFVIELLRMQPLLEAAEGPPAEMFEGTRSLDRSRAKP